MGGCPNVSCPRIMNDKDIIDKDCWAGWWLVGATHADEYHDQVYHDRYANPPLVETSYCLGESLEAFFAYPFC